MKKYHLYLWLVALVGLMTSCSQDEAAGPQNEASNRVRIGTSIDEALQTRAASVTIPENHKLRYVLEVWSTAGTPACIYRDEKTATEAAAVAFDFTLSEAGDYKALLWADFVSESASTTQKTSPNTYTHYADLHYTTDSDNGLKAVTLAKTGTNYVINDDARDAFFACIAIKKETGAFEENVELKRPFGQINVIEKNTELLAKVTSMTLTYSVPEKFDVETGSPSVTVAVNPTVNTLPTATADRKANLFYDFIFTATTAQTLVSEITLTFTDNDQAINLDKFTIPANMPAVRNKRTNISGSILHTSIAPSDGAKLTVTVSDAWTTPDEEKELAKPYDWYTRDKDAATFTLSTATELREFANLVNGTDEAKAATGASGHVTFEGKTVQIADGVTTLDLNNEEWTPIGNSTSNSFQGTFDGNGSHISNLNVNVGTNNVGLFGHVKAGTVRNLRVSGTVKSSGIQVGGIVGVLNSNSTAKNCIFSGEVSGKNYVGGIAGISNASITGCHTNGSVTATDQNTSYAGGIVGNASSGTSVGDCYSSATVSATSNYSGGVTGNIANGQTVTRCYATGTVSGKDYVGGIAGNSNGTAEYCLALNPSITRTTGTNIHFGRITSYYSSSSAVVTSCAAYNGMTIKDANDQIITNRTGADGDDLDASACLTETTYNTDRGFTADNGWAFDSGTTWQYLPWNKAFESFHDIQPGDYRIEVPEHLKNK